MADSTTPDERDAGGLEFLRLATEVLQQARLADDEAGLWEAADFQWWWRRDQHPDHSKARFWFGHDGTPVAFVAVTDWGQRWGCDVVATAADGQLLRRSLWPHALDRVRRLPAKPIEAEARDDDVLTAAVLGEAGFVAVDESAMTCWMHAADRPDVAPIADGYRLKSTATRAARAHHMVARSGPHVAERLRECSLYQPELDLYIEGPDDDIAGYALFWADPITGVGLVEPMRTEDRHQNKGLGRHLLHSGLELLAARGCTRLKVTYIEGNEPARRLYVNAGFQPRTASRIFRRLP